MAKTLLKMVLGVLVLSGFFFLGLQFWEKNKARKAQLAAQSAAAEKSLKEVNVTSSTQGASIEIKDITGSTYAISNQSKGILITFPELTLTLAQKNIPMPHPLLESIEATEMSAGQVGAKVAINFSSKNKYKTRQEGGSLFIDVEKEPEVTPTPEPIAEKIKPAPKKPVRSVSRGKQKKIVSRPVKKAVVKKQSAASAPKKSTPKASAQEDEFLAQLGIVDGPAQPDPVPTEAAANLPAEESFGSDVGGAFEDPAAQVAMNNPPAAAQNFDPGQVTANLPAITDLQVVNEGGITKVRVTRGAKVKYKVFPKRDPNRIVIDFQNVVNQLPSEMGGFSGTRVDKVKTSQFVSSEGTISRVELFLNAIPQVDRSTITNSGKFFEIPIP